MGLIRFGLLAATSQLTGTVRRPLRVDLAR